MIEFLQGKRHCFRKAIKRYIELAKIKGEMMLIGESKGGQYSMSK